MICPGCGRARGIWRCDVGDRLFGTTMRRFQVLRCPACSLEFQAPGLTSQDLARFYPPAYWVGAGAGDRRTPRAGLWWRAVECYRRLALRDHVRFVRRVVMEQKARAGAWRGLLDVGCGDGSVLAALGVRPAVGLDWSREAARAVAERGFAVVCGELENTPFKASTFSVLTMFHYLEHVSPARLSLEAARRLLAPDGRLVVQVPNRDCWQRALLRSRWAGYDPPRHLIHYSTSTLRDTLERHGYDVLRVTHAAIRDNPATFANSVVPRLYPPAREARVRRNGSARRFAAAFAYLGVVAAATPFALLESLSGCGATVMMEARPRNAEH